jgi:hypothetical protein
MENLLILLLIFFYELKASYNGVKYCRILNLYRSFFPFMNNTRQAAHMTAWAWFGYINTKLMDGRHTTYISGHLLPAGVQKNPVAPPANCGGRPTWTHGRDCVTRWIWWKDLGLGMFQSLSSNFSDAFQTFKNDQSCASKYKSPSAGTPHSWEKCANK